MPMASVARMNANKTIVAYLSETEIGSEGHDAVTKMHHFVCER